MNTQGQQRIKLRNANMRGPYNGSILIATIIFTVILALAIVFGARAVESIGEIAGSAALKVPGDYATIQAAIDAARPGDIIQVSAGAAFSF